VSRLWVRQRGEEILLILLGVALPLPAAAYLLVEAPLPPEAPFPVEELLWPRFRSRARSCWCPPAWLATWPIAGRSETSKRWNLVPADPFDPSLRVRAFLFQLTDRITHRLPRRSICSA